MFYDIYCSLCKRAGLTPTKAAAQIGISKGTVSSWKVTPDVIPSGKALSKVSAFFDVTVDSLLKTKKEPAADESEELAEYLEELKNRSEMRMLFSLAAGSTKADVEKAVRIIEALRDSNHEE